MTATDSPPQSTISQEAPALDPPPSLYRYDRVAPAAACLEEVDESWLAFFRSPANTSALPRRALQFHYKPASAGQLIKEQRMQLFGGEALGAEC